MDAIFYVVFKNSLIFVTFSTLTKSLNFQLDIPQWCKIYVTYVYVLYDVHIHEQRSVYIQKSFNHIFNTAWQNSLDFHSNAKCNISHAFEDSLAPWNACTCPYIIHRISSFGSRPPRKERISREKCSVHILKTHFATKLYYGIPPSCSILHGDVLCEQ